MPLLPEGTIVWVEGTIFWGERRWFVGFWGLELWEFGYWLGRRTQCSGSTTNANAEAVMGEVIGSEAWGLCVEVALCVSLSFHP